MGIALNCDLGEVQHTWETGRDQLILPFLTYVNISCGAHAGSEKLISSTLLTAKNFGLIIGAHPGYPDKENFGRISLDMGIEDFIQSMTDQLLNFRKLAQKFQVTVSYVKPHGALYNDLVKNAHLAAIFTELVQKIDPSLAIMGMPIGALKEVCSMKKCSYISEAFIDRQYLADGTLVPRSHADGVITNIDKAINQLKSIATGQGISTLDNKKITIKADTFCIHGDSEIALELVKAINNEGLLN